MYGVDAERLTGCAWRSRERCKIRYPSELEGQLTLPNGNWLRIRPLRPSEDAAIREFYRHLTLRTRPFDCCRRCRSCPTPSSASSRLSTTVGEWRYSRGCSQLIAQGIPTDRPPAVAISPECVLEEGLIEEATVKETVAFHRFPSAK